MRTLFIYTIVFFTTFANAQTWYERQIIPFDAMDDDHFGADIAIYDSLLFISNLRYSNSVDACVYVYILVNNDYVFETKIYPDDPESLALFGTRLLYKDGQLFVGARNKKLNGIPVGALYIFTYESNGWLQKQKIFPPEPLSFNGYFSNAIVKLNETLVVSAYRAHSGAEYSGKVFIYKYINKQYFLQQELAPYDAKDYQYFGISLVLKDNMLFIGSELDSTSSGFESGSIYSYVKQDSNWVFSRKYIPESNSPNLTLGASMTSNDDFIFAGTAASFSYTQPGKVYIYKISEPLLELHQIIDSDEGYSDDRFGIHMLARGDTLLVTAFFDTVNNSTPGSVYMFVNNNNFWGKIRKIVPPDEITAGLFGNSLAINDRIVFIGAKLSRSYSLHPGKVYLFSQYPLSTTEVEQKPPDMFLVHQNFPNPFNSKTILKYSIPCDCEIIIKVYDLLGQLIKYISVGNSEKGSHNYTIDFSGISSGVYLICTEFIYELNNKTQNLFSTQKVVLIN